MNLGAGVLDFNQIFSQDYINYLNNQEEFSTTFIQFITNSFCSRFSNYEKLSLSNGEVEIPREVSLIAQENAFHKIVSDENYDLNDLERISKSFIYDNQSPETSKILKEVILNNLESKKGVFLIANYKGLLEEGFIDSLELRKKVKKSIIQNIEKGNPDYLTLVREDLHFMNLDENILSDPKTLLTIKKEVLKSIKSGYVLESISLKKELDFLDLEDFFSGPEMALSIKEGIFNLLKSGSLRKILDIQEEFNFLDLPDLLDQTPEGINKELAKQVKNICESFLVNYRESLPTEVLETLERFENNYGGKGKDLVALAISTYGLENPGDFSKKMENLEKVLNKYDHDSIPEELHVSMGIEYEVTKEVATPFKELNSINYVEAIEAVSRSANIGRGADAIHEIALKPNYNPYMLIAEVKLLQDAGFLDFNFEQYTRAARGYHLSLVGDSGLKVNEDLYFLNNVMTMSQLTGLQAGEDIEETKDIFKKDFEHFSDNEQKGDRCEIKGMATDSVEQFEKAIMTAHHAGIAIQAYNKGLEYTISSDKERDLALEWQKLKEEFEGLIDQHNMFFIDAEFRGGYSLDKDDNYIHTYKDIDVRRNMDLLGEEKVNSPEFKNSIYLEKQDLYSQQQVRFVNTLTHINNIFLKDSIEGHQGTVNALNMLNTMKQEWYGEVMNGKPQDSIFENGGVLRDGYYNVQGASEEMITHKAQILLNRFNRNVENILKVEEKDLVEQESLIKN